MPLNNGQCFANCDTVIVASSKVTVSGSFIIFSLSPCMTT